MPWLKDNVATPNELQALQRQARLRNRLVIEQYRSRSQFDVDLF